MINIWCYDVEILPNFFSITFVNLSSYTKTFKDSCNITIKKGKEKRIPIPLTEKYKVSDIKTMLDSVESKTFWISDFDDSQLLAMIGFINSLQAKKDGNKNVFTHCYGYNSGAYDKLMVACLLMYYNMFSSTKELIRKLYDTSKKIIDLQDNEEISRKDYYLDSLRKYPLPYYDVDLMKIFALNKAGTIIGSDGKKSYYGKSLKQTSINLKWYELLEYELPPICEKDAELYYNNQRYSGFTYEQLNSVIDKWDRFMIPEYIEPTMHYNKNDVFIVCEMARLYSDEIKLRYSISNAYEVNVLNSSRSNVADILFTKFYSEFSNLTPKQWQGKKTERHSYPLKKVIFDNIKFKTKPLQDLLEELKKTTLYSVGKDALNKTIVIGNTKYTLATGGLHSQDPPRVLKSKLIECNPSTGRSRAVGEAITDFDWDNYTDDSYVYIHADVSSFYPSLMTVYKIAPEHLDTGCFTKLVGWLRDTRVKAKHSEEDIIDGIPKDILAQALKIVINSIYGKLGAEFGNLFDRLAVLKVTINGQLFAFMLSEELELNDIPVVSANTDGIVVKVRKDKYSTFQQIYKNWEKYTGLSLDEEFYSAYVDRDINNYFSIELNGKYTYKGDLNPDMYKVDLSKGYNAPIVAKAAIEFLAHNKPVLETLYECKDILDFCKTQNIGRQFHTEFYKGQTKEILQRQIRFYVSMIGGNLFKVSKEGTLNNLCAGYKVNILNTLDDTPIELRNINYSYYADEAYKIIDPIKLGISPNQKGNPNTKTKSGKSLLKKNAQAYFNLFDDEED